MYECIVFCCVNNTITKLFKNSSFNSHVDCESDKIMSYKKLSHSTKVTVEIKCNDVIQIQEVE